MPMKASSCAGSHDGHAAISARTGHELGSSSPSRARITGIINWTHAFQCVKVTIREISLRMRIVFALNSIAP